MSKGNKPVITKRVLWAGLVVFVFLCSLFGYIFQTSLLKLVEENYESLAMDTISRTADQLDYRITLYEMLAASVAYNSDLSRRLSEDYGSIVEVWESIRAIAQSFDHVYSELPGILDFRIYHENETIVEDGAILWIPSERILNNNETEETWYQRYIGKKGIHWEASQDASEMLAIVSSCVGSSLTATTGLVYIEISMRRAFQDAIQSSQYAQGYYVVIDTQGQIILSTVSGDVGQNIKNTDYNSDHLASIDLDEQVFVAGGEIIGYSSLSNGWSLIGVIPLSQFRTITNNVTRNQLFFTICILAIGMAVIIMIVRNLRHRISKFDERLRAMAHGELNVSLDVNGKDEFTNVEIHFNNMVSRIKALMHEVELRKAQELEETLRTMESYVNPHFLYNTLGLIRWRALDHGDDDLCSLIDDMTAYYRLSLSSGRSIVSVADEVQHLKAYISIQQRRYDDVVMVLWDIDEAACDAQTPKNILQTIVENCYVHGLDTSRPDNVIQISVNKLDNQIRFMVKDNGKGIEKRKLSVLQSNDVHINTGIGIRSIRQRLRLYFGEDTNMQIESTSGNGTTVMIWIPYKKYLD